ncbi:MAG: hypothetical protein KF791_18535 [Verrucomicrobiae bacterium]|nr:hypothetical protein [Verrucomicrobiae bacterium]
MSILVDENIPNLTVRELRTMAHDVLDIRGTERQEAYQVYRPDNLIMVGRGGCEEISETDASGNSRHASQ